MTTIFVVKKLKNISGGAEKICVNLASHLARQGQDIKLVSFDAPDSESFYPVDPAVTRVYLGDADDISILSRISKLRKSIPSLKPDIVIGFMHSSYCLLMIALMGTGIRYIASEHTVPSYYKKRPFEYVWMLLALLFSAKATVCSQQNQDLLPRFVHQKLNILPNPVFVTPSKNPQTRKDTIISVGRLDENKNHKMLIEAFAVLANDHKQWSLKIIGDGVLRGQLEQQVHELKLQDRITLAGALSSLDPEYEQAKLCVHPSFYESFGLAPVEAMAHGVPVIGFADCTGVNDIIEDAYNGLLVSPRSSETLAAAIASLLENEKQRATYAENAAKTAKIYAPTAVFKEWESFL